MGVLADRGTFCAMCAQIERAVPGGFLSRPDAVFDFGQNRAADRAMRADRLQNFDFAVAGSLSRSGGDPSDTGSKCRDATDGQTGSAQERPTIKLGAFPARERIGADRLLRVTLLSFFSACHSSLIQNRAEARYFLTCSVFLRPEPSSTSSAAASSYRLQQRRRRRAPTFLLVFKKSRRLAPSFFLLSSKVLLPFCLTRGVWPPASGLHSEGFDLDLHESAPDLTDGCIEDRTFGGLRDP